MKKLRISLLFGLFATVLVTPTFASRSLTTALDATTSWMAIQTSYEDSAVWGTRAVNSVIIGALSKILLPIILFVGIILAMFWFYSMMTSTSDDAMKKGMNYIIWWVVGIIVIVSANFLATMLYGDGGWGWVFSDASWAILSGPEIAYNLYKKMIYPFVRFLMYFLMAGLFLVAMVRAIWLLFSNKDDWAKQAGSIIKRNAFGILIIIFSKSLIEAIYGKEEEVVNSWATSVGTVGGAVDMAPPFIFTIINYVMWFIGLFLLVMIILQAVQIITKPTDEAMQKKLRNNVIYMLIGLAVMWLSYVITNVLLVR